MKVTIELTTLDEVKAVVAALEGKNTQAALQLAPAAEVKAAEEPAKTEPAKRGRKPKSEVAVETPAEETSAEAKNEDTGTEAEVASTVEPEAGDIDDAKMREIGGKLLREMNAKGKDGVGELTKILSSLSSKKVTEVPMNLRPRFVAKVEEALA